MGFHDSDDASRMSSAWKVSHNHNDTAKDNDMLLRQLDDARSVVSGHMNPYSDGGHDDGIYSVSGRSISGRSITGRSIARSRAGSHLGYDDTASVVSGWHGVVL